MNHRMTPEVPRLSTEHRSFRGIEHALIPQIVDGEHRSGVPEFPGAFGRLQHPGRRRRRPVVQVENIGNPACGAAYGENRR